MDPINHRLRLWVTLAASAGALFFLVLAAWPATAAAPFLSPLGASPGGFLPGTSTPTPGPGCPLAWHRTPSPNISTNDNNLNGVAAISSNDVWAVGGYFDQATFESRPLIEHWDGTQWTAVTPPAVRATLSGVAAVSANNVW